MAIISTSGITNKALYAAYRPVIIGALDNGASGTPPEVYCDIYFDSVYYKTISSNVPDVTAGSLTLWQFDISGIAQEYIKTKVYDVTATTVETVYDGLSNLAGQTYTYCKIRTSTADSYGVITPGGPLPVQATYSTPAVAGGGYVSDQVWYIVNASLQIQDSMTLLSQLQSFRVGGTVDAITVDPGYKIYQLSYMTKGYSYLNDYGQIALLSADGAYHSGASTANLYIRVVAYNSAGTVIASIGSSAVTFYSNRIFTVPIGLANIVQMFPTITSYLPNMAFYRVLLFDPANTLTAYVTPRIYYLNRDGVVNNMNYNVPKFNTIVPKHTRIWFKNYLGQFDAVNFIERTEKLKVTSSSYEVPLTAVPDGYLRNQVSRGRYNVRSSEVNVATGYFSEDHMQLLKQLFATSQAYLEMTSPEDGGDAPAVVLVPIVILDAEYDTQMFENRFQYEVNIQYMPSNENIIVR